MLIIAVARLCYLDAIETSFDPSSKLLKDLLLIDPTNLESRALIGWHLSHQRRSRTVEDQEQKHYVATLRHFDKHDTYSLISLANATLRHARELRPQTEAEKEKRKKEYARAVDMFQKALELQPKNAYAAQGVAIAFAEEKNYVQANMIFNKVKETLKDASVFINMGHCCADQRDWVRAIQNVFSISRELANDSTKLLWKNLMAMSLIYFAASEGSGYFVAERKRMQSTSVHRLTTPAGYETRFIFLILGSCIVSRKRKCQIQYCI